MTSSRLRIAVVASSYSTHISANHVLIAQGLAERGHEVILVSTEAKNVRFQDYPDQARSGDRGLRFPVLRVPYVGVFRDNVVTLPVLRGLPQKLDVVLLQEDYPVLCMEVGQWALRRFIPIVISSERYFYPADPLVAGALRSMDRTILRRLWGQSGALTFHSHASLRFFAAHGAPSERLSFIPAAIDAEGFAETLPVRAASRERATPERFEVLCIARLHPYKGLESLISAVEILAKQGLNLHFQIRGRGPLESQLRRRISASGVEGSVTLETDPIANSEVPYLMASSDLYVQPSVYEPFGSAVVEAMACRLPVVASAVGGMCDTVADGVTGVLVPPADPVRLSHAIGELAEDGGRRHRMGEAGQARAVKLFDYRVLTQKYEELVRGLLP